MIKKLFIIRQIAPTSLLVSAILFADTAYAELVVIGGYQLPINKLSKQQVENLYLGSSDLNIAPLDQHSDSNLYTQFYQKLMGWGSSQIGNYWSQKVFSGEANQPVQVENQAQAISAVLHSNHTIAYVDSSALQGYGGYKVLYSFGPAVRSGALTQQQTAPQSMQLQHAPVAVVRHYPATVSAASPQAPHHLVLHQRVNAEESLQSNPKMLAPAGAASAMQQQLPSSSDLTRYQGYFKNFMRSFSSFNRLLKASSGQTYFTAVRLDPNNPNSLQLKTTKAFWAQPSSQRRSIINTILRQWQQSMDYNKKDAAIEIADEHGMTHRFS